jgi:glycosyltransferase involved in cell wall biosynthesis
VNLTIGLPCHNDFDGVYFTVQALLMYHAEVMEQAEIVVIDNAPGTQHGEYTRDFVSNAVANGRYIPYTDITGPAAAKNRVFAEARGAYVVCMDAHVLLVPGALRKLISYYADNPATNDLLQGPLMNDDQRTFCTHMDPVWRGEMFGIWGTDLELMGEEAERSPREIEMHGLGCFSCRKESWLGFNPMFSGFGGEEGYLHQKYRNAGHTTRLLPFLKWLHRFPRTHPIQFPCTRYHKIRNYLIGWAEVGLPLAPVLEHFAPVTPDDELQTAIRDSGVPVAQSST